MSSAASEDSALLSTSSDEECLMGRDTSVSTNRSKAATFASPCCACCVVICSLILWFHFRVYTAGAALKAFPHDYILPENAKKAGVPEYFDRGDATNMDLSLLDIDLAGTWWMDGNAFTFEQLVSFTSAAGSPPFPCPVSVYSNRAGRWTWSDDYMGRAAQAYYAFDADVDTAVIFNFTNSTFAWITAVAEGFGGKNFDFRKIDDDQWARPDANYVLRRIVAADGTKGPYWDNFDQWYRENIGEKIVVWTSNSTCKRRLQYFLPDFLTNLICG